jgi:hypothetical protein
VVANMNIVVAQAALWGLMQRIIGLGLEAMDLHLVTPGLGVEQSGDAGHEHGSTG